MIIETPSWQFVNGLPEPLSRSDCFYVWPEPPRPYVTQAFAKLHKEVLVGIYKVRSSISTQYSTPCGRDAGGTSSSSACGWMR